MAKASKPPVETQDPEAAEAQPQAPLTFEEQHADLIREKVRAGLTRSQAIEVIKAQIAHDQTLAAAARPAK